MAAARFEEILRHREVYQHQLGSLISMTHAERDALVGAVEALRQLRELAEHFRDRGIYEEGRAADGRGRARYPRVPRLGPGDARARPPREQLLDTVDTALTRLDGLA